jgi:hypothetical protein
VTPPWPRRPGAPAQHCAVAPDWLFMIAERQLFMIAELGRAGARLKFVIMTPGSGRAGRLAGAAFPRKRGAIRPGRPDAGSGRGVSGRAAGAVGPALGYAGAGRMARISAFPLTHFEALPVRSTTGVAKPWQVQPSIRTGPPPPFPGAWPAVIALA